MPPRRAAESPHREASQLRFERVALTVATEAVEQSVKKGGTLAGSISNEVGKHARRLLLKEGAGALLPTSTQVAREVIEPGLSQPTTSEGASSWSSDRTSSAAACRIRSSLTAVHPATS